MSRTPEQLAWDALRPILVAGDLDPKRVENVVGKGHPDINVVGGDVELKAIAEFPKKSTTNVRIPKFFPEQRNWLLARSQAGGRAWLLVRVGSHHGAEWFLFNGLAAAQVYDGLTQFHWRQRATLHGRMDAIRSRLIDKLRGPRD